MTRVIKYISFSLFLVTCLYLIAAEPKADTEPTPLVIETQEIEEVIGVYEGTITITGEGIDDICYEGVLQITKDGKSIRVTANDVIRSNFADLF